MQNENGQFTPTQQRIMNVLNDGLTHPKSELMACLDDEMSDKSNLSVHLTYLRRKLRKKGLEIVSSKHGGNTTYRLVRTLTSPYRE